MKPSAKAFFFSALAPEGAIAGFFFFRTCSPSVPLSLSPFLKFLGVQGASFKKPLPFPLFKVLDRRGETRDEAQGKLLSRSFPALPYPPLRAGAVGDESDGERAGKNLTPDGEALFHKMAGGVV